MPAQAPSVAVKKERSLPTGFRKTGRKCGAGTGTCRMRTMADLIKSRLPDLVACGALAAFGVAAIWIGASYPIGTINRMGAGFFPIAASIIVVVLAGAAAIEVLLTEPVPQKFKLRPVIFISVAIFVWARLIDAVGLIPATFALILLAGLAKPPFRPVSLIISAALLCAAGYVVFMWGLHMPLTLLGR